MATDFEGVEVDPTGCGCTELQILAAINQNIVNFGQVYTGGGGGSSEWGGITGDIGDQTDLQSEFDGKQDKLNNSAGLAAAVGDGTGTGAAVFNDNPTLLGYTLTGPTVVTYTAMPALAVNMAKPGNTYSATGDVTFTYSNNTPTAGTRTILKITSDSTARTITIPSTWSLTRGGNITTLLVPASTTLAVLLEYTGARWEIYGDPVASTGSGNFVLQTGPTITSPQISLTAAHGTDDTYTGITMIGLNAGATIAQWEIVYLGGSSTWLLADANGSGTYPAAGIAVAAYSSTNPATILKEGTVRNDAWNWTPGGRLYMSATPGALTQTAPSTSGDKVQDVGFALTADIAILDFNGTYLTVA